MADILIDLGPKWGHVVPLSVLEQISHIEIADNNQIKVSCSIREGKNIRQFRFNSRKGFSSEKELDKEKGRLLGFSNGLIALDDMKKIVKAIEEQTGEKPEVVLKEPMYDISFVRRMWASMHGIPFFKMSLVYDPEGRDMLIDEDHNDEFLRVIPEWLDQRTLSLVEKDQERLMMFAYEVLYNMVEPFMPEPEDGAYMDPNADIPVIGSVGVKQTVDLTNVDPSNVIQTSG